ncbi:protein giant-lens-like [Limulus polyphemus]|uniref:Protein giant-lens-like n=1 Tax=Limulus polyphemus TaxID=6850 RepID=A0ABM1B4H6_LIMPO|nr:protein giant-lens-like [Limulus polyphemus]
MEQDVTVSVSGCTTPTLPRLFHLLSSPYSKTDHFKSGHAVLPEQGVAKRLACRAVDRKNSEEDLPECSHFEVCNKVDTYSTPWIERQCRCPAKHSCSLSSKLNDGHTVLDKSTQFKLCEPVSKLPTCRYFRDVTWTYVSHPDNTTQQIMHCVCPKNSVAYILNHQAFYTLSGVGYRYAFVCSPQSWQRCERKEPCRLFTVKKRPGVEEVNSSRLCECPLGFICPERYAEPSVMVDTIGNEDRTRTYSGYCAPAAD